MGHPGWYRKRPTEFDRLVLVPAPCHCPYCDGLVKARPDLPAYDHIQEDWIDGRRVVTCYRHEGAVVGSVAAGSDSPARTNCCER